MADKEKIENEENERTLKLKLNARPFEETHSYYSWALVQQEGSICKNGFS